MAKLEYSPIALEKLGALTDRLDPLNRKYTNFDPTVHKYINYFPGSACFFPARKVE
jgi:hypothetical protein